MTKIQGPFPANTPESERFKGPSPNYLEQQRIESGGLSDDPTESGLPVDNGPKPFKGLRSR